MDFSAKFLGWSGGDWVVLDLVAKFDSIVEASAAAGVLGGLHADRLGKKTKGFLY